MRPKVDSSLESACKLTCTNLGLVDLTAEDPVYILWNCEILVTNCFKGKVYSNLLYVIIVRTQLSPEREVPLPTVCIMANLFTTEPSKICSNIPNFSTWTKWNNITFHSRNLIKMIKVVEINRKSFLRQNSHRQGLSKFAIQRHFQAIPWKHSLNLRCGLCLLD